MATATLLLPARSRFPAGTLPVEVARALGRADRDSAQDGELAQLRRHFRPVPEAWPVAALTRQLDVGDADGACWLRADPAYVVPDMQGARLMGYGETLQLDTADIAQLLPMLKPLFGDHGFILDAPVASRWYLRLPPGSPLPAFAPPDEVLGDDLFGHLPAGDLGRRWRSLLTEAQVLLHQHPWNRQRIAQGKPAINSLWFWGAGLLPEAVTTPHVQVRSRDALLQALAKAAGVVADDREQVDALVDLRQLRSLQQLGADVIMPLLAALARGELHTLVLDFQDGAQFRIDRRQRWRFWRKPLPALGA
ncbi:phosphoglycerate mutase [Stenotrophomonas sp. YIM B06876]|uniref:phosphoglycerate mutase n=1 Tax=Stenotrophomonas sp. YIM B06876 TaxID=3060211 RepID=UPI002739D878|nr:phosphoglycerate mutase [Stenotrophomonas sp. YIM B06876]